MAVVVDCAAAHRQLMAVGSISISPTLMGLGGSGPLEAAQHGLDAGNQFARAEGLGDVVVGAEFEAEDAVGFAALGGEKDDRHGGKPGGLANGAADIEAVFAGNHDVEHEERGRAGVRRRRARRSRWDRRGP